MKETTLCIIKPDAVKLRHVGDIVKKLEYSGFLLVEMKVMHQGPIFWNEFYREHKGKDFFPELVQFMSSGPAVFIMLEKANAIKDYRKLMGPSDPKNAPHYTLRARYGLGTPNNAVHGSDSEESAFRELDLVFGMR